MAVLIWWHFLCISLRVFVKEVTDCMAQMHAEWIGKVILKQWRCSVLVFRSYFRNAFCALCVFAIPRSLQTFEMKRYFDALNSRRTGPTR